MVSKDQSSPRQSELTRGEGESGQAIFMNLRGYEEFVEASAQGWGMR